MEKQLPEDERGSLKDVLVLDVIINHMATVGSPWNLIWQRMSSTKFQEDSLSRYKEKQNHKQPSYSIWPTEVSSPPLFFSPLISTHKNSESDLFKSDFCSASFGLHSV